MVFIMLNGMCGRNFLTAKIRLNIGGAGELNGNIGRRDRTAFFILNYPEFPDSWLRAKFALVNIHKALFRNEVGGSSD